MIIILCFIKAYGLRKIFSKFCMVKVYFEHCICNLTFAIEYWKFHPEKF